MVVEELRGELLSEIPTEPKLDLFTLGVARLLNGVEGECSLHTPHSKPRVADKSQRGKRFPIGENMFPEGI